MSNYDLFDDSREAITSGEMISIDIDENKLHEYSLTVSAIDHSIFRIEEVSGIMMNFRYGDRIEVRHLPSGEYLLLRLTEPSDFNTEVYIISEKASTSTLVRGVLSQIVDAGGNWEILFGGILTITGPKEILDRYLPKLDVEIKLLQ